MRKNMAAVLAGVAAATAVTAMCTADVQAASYEWRQDEGGWWYQLEDGSFSRDELRWIDGVTYYFDSNGYMQTGWICYNGQWYYMDGSGAMQTGWIYDRNHWYSLAGNGIMETGWQSNGGGQYYMDDSGAMQTGWIYDDGEWYYTDDSGKMQTGWQYVNGHWYYFDSHGRMQSGWLKDGKKKYYLDGSGAMATGWIYDNGHWYFPDQTGAIFTGGWQWINDAWYSFNTDGSMKCSEFDDGYYLKDDGSMASGEWLQIGDDEYYFNDDGTMMHDEWKDGYYLKSDGKMAVSTWIDDYTYVDETGKIDPNQKGWLYDPIVSPFDDPNSFESRLLAGTATLDEVRNYVLEQYNISLTQGDDPEYQYGYGKHRPPLAKVKPVVMDDRYNASAQWYAEYLERTYYDISDRPGVDYHSCSNLDLYGIKEFCHMEGLFQCHGHYTDVALCAKYMPEHTLSRGKIDKIGIGAVYLERVNSWIVVIQSFDLEDRNGNRIETPIPEYPDINTIPVLHKTTK